MNHSKYFEKVKTLRDCSDRDDILSEIYFKNVCYCVRFSSSYFLICIAIALYI
nr:MAG TPA: hypothetical protein [Bacteriophage sp.]